MFEPRHLEMHRIVFGQEAILRVVRKERQFADRTELRMWPFRVAQNPWIDKTRKSSTSTNRPLQLRDLVAVNDSPDRKAELTEQMEATFAECNDSRRSNVKCSPSGGGRDEHQ